MIALPAGEVIFTRRVRGADVRQLLPRRKRWFYLKIASPLGRGWVIFEDRKRVFAAHFDDGFDEYSGSAALGRVAAALADAEVELGVIGESVAKLFAAMHPHVVVDGERSVDVAFTEARTLDAIDAAVGRVSVEMFTEEWEEAAVESESSESAEEVEPSAVEAESPEAEEERKWVVNFEEFVYGLKNFTGICRGRDGSFEVEVYLKDGEIVAAIVRDEDIELRGEAALFYLDRPLEVELRRCEVELPEDAICTEDRRSVEALYTELDRKGERGGERLW